MFPAAVSGADKTRIRTSGYWSRTYCAISPNEVIFQAQVAEDIDAAFIEFNYDNVAVGAYTDVLPGLVAYLSPTTDLRDAVYRGRVPRNPTSSVFYIDLNSTVVTDGMYILVTADSDYFAKVRQGDLEDGFTSYHNLEPMIADLPGCVVLYDSDNDGGVSFAPAQTGIAVADGATISSWSWAIRGGGVTSYTSGSSTSQNPVIQLAAGYKYMIQCNVTDSNGVTHFQWVQAYAVTRTFGAPVVLPVAAGSITNTLTDGFSASITAYADVTTLVNRSHVAVFKVEHFGDNSGTPVLTNLRFAGRLKSESIQTDGTAEAGQVQQVNFSAESIASYMQGLRCPNDIVRAKASPAAFGEITDPTVFRMLVYYMSLYTTFLNNGSFSAGNDNMLAWVAGGEPVSMDGGYALDVLTTTCDKIHAAPNFSPDGSIYIAQLAAFMADRSGIETIVDLTLADLTGYQLDIDTSRQVGQVVAFGGSWNTTSNIFVLYTASAPAVPYSDAPENAESNRELLTVDASTTEAQDELKLRAGNAFAYGNPKPLLRLGVIDSWNWLFATGYQRYTATIPASSNSRGVAYDTADYWQLQSISLAINPDGSDDVTVELVAETENDDAQATAALLPVNLSDMNPVFPNLSDNPAIPDDSLWMFPTDTPTPDEYPAIDPYSGLMTGSPFSPDQAAQVAAQQPPPNCRAFQVNMRNPGTTNSPFITSNLQAYTLKITGNGTLSAGWFFDILFNNTDTFSNGQFLPWIDGLSNPRATYVPGVGFERGGTTTPDQAGAVQIVANFTSPVSFTIDAVRIFGSIAPADGYQFRMPDVGGADFASGLQGAGLTSKTISVNATSSGVWVSIDNGAGVDYLGAMTRLRLTGSGTNPFTGDAPVVRGADWFYNYDPSDPDVLPELFAATEGGLIAGAKPMVIPDYSPNHEYTIPYTGDGNSVQAAFALASYTGVPNRVFTLQLCRI